MGLAKRYEAIRSEVTETAEQVGRAAEEVRIIAVSKTVDVDTIGEAIEAGVKDFGENRPDALAGKQARYPNATWHFIGNIQSRKIPDIVASADMIHSVYKVSHLSHLEEAARKQGKVQDILAEVNMSGEESKGGLRPDEVPDFVQACMPLEHVRLCGFMTMAPQGDLERAQTCFKELTVLQKEIREQFSDSMISQDLRELSMGMSEDWSEAIAAGATMVRIGRAIFDECFGQS